MRTLPHSARPHGFSLLELLVVIAIAALLAGLVPIAYSRVQEGAQYRDTVRSVWTALRTLREEAYTTGTTTQFAIDLESKQFAVGNQTRTIPAELELRTTVAELGNQAGIAAIWFLAEGGSTGGSIEIVRPNGDGTRLRVDWLTGDITQEVLLP